MHIDMIGDVMCPWCFIGKRRLERALARRPRIPVSLSWRPFQINPLLAPEGMDRKAYLVTKFGSEAQVRLLLAAIAEAGAGENIAFEFDRIRRTPNSLDAHRLIAWADQEGAGQGGRGKSGAMIDALFHAYFIEGADIGDSATLARIAGTQGLSPKEAASFLESETGIEEVLTEDHAARRFGISGVPCFIIDGKWTLAGAMEPEFFLPLFDLAANARSAA